MKTRYLIFLLIPLTFASCLEKGCMDKKASNYNVGAEVSDGSCKYITPIKTANIIFWQDSLNSVDLTNIGSTKLFLYLNNSLVDSCDASQYLNEEPLCDIGLGIMDNHYHLGDQYSEDVDYEIRDQTGTVIDYGDRILIPGGCSTVKIIY